MDIKHAEISDAPLIHSIMMHAFMEYKDEVPPSSALKETVQSIAAALKKNEQSFIGYMADKPVGMIRFQVKEDSLYFYRLAVIPEQQGQGIAKEMIKYLEDYAFSKEIFKVCCQVRATLPKNIHFYQSIGYNIGKEEIVYNSNRMPVQVVSMEKCLTFSSSLKNSE